MIIFAFIVRAILALIHGADVPAKPCPTEAEIDAALAQRAQERGLKDNDWKNSITDLLVLLGIPNSFHYRGGLYMELGGEGEYRGSASQNTWMIQQVRLRFAEGRLD